MPPSTHSASRARDQGDAAGDPHQFDLDGSFAVRGRASQWKEMIVGVVIIATVVTGYYFRINYEIADARKDHAALVEEVHSGALLSERWRQEMGMKLDAMSKSLSNIEGYLRAQSERSK